jgi:hypothetical protein
LSCFRFLFGWNGNFKNEQKGKRTGTMKKQKNKKKRRKRKHTTGRGGAF